MKRSGIVIACVVLSLVASACSSSDDQSGAIDSGSDSERIEVATSFYPLQWLTERVGGSAVDVTSIIPEGTEPHEAALDAKSLERLRQSDVVVYVGDEFQPELEKAIADLPSDVVRNDVLRAEGLTRVGDRDPHVWMDPLRMQNIARSVAASLRHEQPEASAEIDSNLAKLMSDLADLDSTMRGRLTACAQTTIVTSHAAFAYLADRYQLTQLPIAGISPDDEPDPKQLQELARTARTAGVGTVYFEDQLPTELADTVAREVGAKTDLLSAAEFDPAADGASGDYLSIQQDNAERLAKGLGCRS